MTTRTQPSTPKRSAYDDLERLLNIDEETDAQPERAPATRRRSGLEFKFAAIAVWIGACFTTYLALAALQPDVPWWILAIAGVAIQGTVTVIELPMWRRKGFNWLSLVVLVGDVFVNAGGLFPALANVGNTPTAKMLQAGGVPADTGALPTILLALALGAIIAAAPEALWQMD